MDFIEELRWRGMLFDLTPGVEEHLSSGKRIAYIGFDPTAASLTIGNYVQIMLLSLFQKHGHTPVVLMGGATGRIGDPSFKDKERELKPEAEIERNLHKQAEQIKKMLAFEGVSNPAILIDNYDFYRNMGAIEFLRDVGKSLTINYMMAKESVKKRIETGLSFTEFSYQLLQGHDFQCLYEQHGVTIQMGGSDQWGNITTGTEIIRRNTEGKAYAITTPLLTKADGSKFGKSESGNLWMDESLSSPYEFYQFWINADDRDISKYIRYFTFRSQEEVERAEIEYAENPQGLKQWFGRELTARIHGEDNLEAVIEVSEMLFDPNVDNDFLCQMSPLSFQIIKNEIHNYTILMATHEAELSLVDLLTEKTTVFLSKSAARRAIEGNAVTINKLRVADVNRTIHGYNDWICDRFMILENGRKNKILIERIVG
ncbi:MAG: tyrosine--tRNA ligase [Saprospiraceae bacterium]